MSVFNAIDPHLRPVLAELLAREPIFHRPAHAATLDDFANLMAPDYWEVGASGRRYSRAYILEHLAEDPPEDATTAGWKLFDPQCRQVEHNVFLITYTLSQNQNRRTRRSTLWRRTPAGWQIIYHQGTVIAAEEDDRAPHPATHTLMKQ